MPERKTWKLLLSLEDNQIKIEVYIFLVLILDVLCARDIAFLVSNVNKLSRNIIDSFANTLTTNAILLFLLQPRRNTFTYFYALFIISEKKRGGGGNSLQRSG